MSSIDGETEGNLCWAHGPGRVVISRVRNPELKLRPFLAPWSPALSCDGDPRGRLASGPLALGLYPSARCSVPGELKLRPFLVPWSPALSCDDGTSSLQRKTCVEPADPRPVAISQMPSPQ
ncbi:uncharacterized protein LOC144582954 isoform X2 [Callithrix jacchus]